MSILYKIANNSGSVVQVLAVQNSQIKLINLLSGEITVSEEFTNQMKTLRDRGLIEIVNLDATIIPVVPETEVEDFEDLPLEGDYIGQFIKVNSQNAYYRWFGNRWKKFIDTETILNSAYDENTGSLLTQLTGSNVGYDSQKDVIKNRPYVPQKYPIVDNNFIFKEALGARPFGIDKNGRIYSYADSVLQYSDDQMANNTTLYSFSENGLLANKHYLVTLLDSGRILASLRETSQTPEGRALYLFNKFTDQSDITFTKVLQLSAPENTIYNRFGFDFHGEILLVGEYSNLYGRYVYMSTDGGETWKTIFDYENYIVNPD